MRVCEGPAALGSHIPTGTGTKRSFARVERPGRWAWAGELRSQRSGASAASSGNPQNCSSRRDQRRRGKHRSIQPRARSSLSRLRRVGWLWGLVGISVAPTLCHNKISTTVFWCGKFQRECLCRCLGCRFWQFGPANLGTQNNPREVHFWRGICTCRSLQYITRTVR